MANTLKVFISSTFSDLAPYRRAAIDVCLSLGMIPIASEYFDARSLPPERAIADEIDEADIFLGIVGFRYGYCLSGTNQSMLEFEYQKATARGIPRIMFLMSETQPVRLADVDMGQAAEQLATFKRRLEKETTVLRFTSEEDLASKVVASMGKIVESLQRDKLSPTQCDVEHRDFIFHPHVGPNIFIDRHEELSELHKWMSDINTTLAIIHGVGGVGKTSLAWKFFEDCLPATYPTLAGRFWWSFYEEPNFRIFTNETARFIGTSAVENTDIGRERQFSQITDLVCTMESDQYLFVLDGIEQLLYAHSTEGMQAQSIHTQRLRRFDSLGAARFFELVLNSSCYKSKILLTSRLIPLELETSSGVILPACHSIALGTLSTEATMQLLMSYGVTGSKEFLADSAAAANNHPLSARLIAGQFADNMSRRPEPDELTQDMLSKTINLAFGRLSKESLMVLQAIASTNGSISYDELAIEFLGGDSLVESPSKLDQVLTDLEDRGLVNWNKMEGTYSVHPVVRLSVLRYMIQDGNNLAHRTEYSAQPDA